MRDQAYQTLTASYAATDAAFELVLKEVAKVAVAQQDETEISHEIGVILACDSWVFAEETKADLRLAA